MEEGKANSTQEFIIQAQTTPSNFQKIVAEFTGTYFLIFLGCGAALVSKAQPLTIVGIAIVWGLVLMAAIYAPGHLSGAHFNPTVAISLAAARKFPWVHLLGATLASLTLRVLFNDQKSLRAIITVHSPTTTDLEALTWEFIISFVLMFTISGVTTDHRASKGLSGVAIGAALLVNVMVAGPITGASMNPARSFGPSIVAGIYSRLWIFIIAPVLGALAATMVYSVLRVPMPEKSEGTKRGTIIRVCKLRHR